MADFGSRSMAREALVGDRVGMDPVGMASTVGREALVGDRVGLNIIGMSSTVVREVLAAESPAFRTHNVVREALAGRQLGRDISQVANVVREVLIRQPDIGACSVAREYLVSGEVSALIEQSAQTTNLVTLTSPYDPMSTVQSYTSVYTVGTSHVSLYPDNTPPMSLTRSTQSVNIAVTANVQAMPISIESVGKALNAITHVASLGYYPPLGEILGNMDTAQVTTLVVQSTSIPYIPPIGAYVPRATSMAVIGSPMISPQSYTSNAQVVSKVVTAKVEPMPWSFTSTDRVTSAVTRGVTYGGLPISMETVKQQTSLAFTALGGVPPIFGLMDSSQSVSLAFIASMPEAFVGAVIGSQSIAQVFTDTTYPLVGDMVSLFTGQVTSWSMGGADYPLMPTVQSYTEYASSRLMFSQLADPALYPNPDDMYAAVPSYLLSQNVELVTQASPVGQVKSMTPVGQFGQLVAQSTYYEPLSDINLQGVRATSLLQQTMCVAEYPSLAPVTSDITADSLVQTVGMAATYPAKGALYSTATVSGLSQSVMASAEFPSKTVLYSRIYADSVTQVTTLRATYGDKGAVLSYSSVDLVNQVTLMRAQYLSKDAVQSFAKVDKLGEQVMSVGKFPALSDVLSAGIVSGVAEQVLSKDVSLYGYPEPPPRRRPIVITRYVW